VDDRRWCHVDEFRNWRGGIAADDSRIDTWNGLHHGYSCTELGRGEPSVS
jgi:hypothetical protein